MRSLRGRLTLGLTLVQAAVLLAAGAYALRDADRTERSVLDDRLERTAELSRATALAAVQEEVPSGDDRLDAVLEASRTSLRLVLGTAALLDVGDPPPRRPQRVPDGFSTFAAGGVRYRSYVTPLRDRSLGGLARLEVTTRLTAVEDRRDRNRRRLALLGLLALTVGAAMVWFASGVVLRPLRRLRDQAASIAGDADLTRRAPTDDGPAETRALAASFNAMLGRLNRSAREREQALDATRRFAADVGHELRTPLTSVQASLSALQRHPGLPADRRTAMAADALEQQRRLVALLDGLQALVRGDAAPPMADVDLAELVDAALAGATAAHPGVDWRADVPGEPVVVRGWEPGLRSLVGNLLENAARHGRPGGTVRVRLHADGTTELSVEDDGPGIPEADRERIFTPFARVEGTESAGSGLGLALVAQQADHHGAGVTLDASPELGGARFVVRF